MVRFIASFRPLLLVALGLSAMLFAPARGVSHTAPNPAPSNTSASQNTATQTPPTGNQTTSGSPSLLAQLFGTAVIDQNFTLPGTTESASGQSTQEPSTEPARSIYRYLVASSEIGFTSDTARVSLALSTAEQGNTDAIDRLIADLETHEAAFLKLTPPDQMRDIHEQSARVLDSYIALLKNARNHAPGEVMATWNGQERADITAQATATTDAIRTIVEQNSITLPTGVLP